jgi:hypothetical protein
LINNIFFHLVTTWTFLYVYCLCQLKRTSYYVKKQSYLNKYFGGHILIVTGRYKASRRSQGTLISLSQHNLIGKKRNKMHGADSHSIGNKDKQE